MPRPLTPLTGLAALGLAALLATPAAAQGPAAAQTDQEMMDRAMEQAQAGQPVQPPPVSVPSNFVDLAKPLLPAVVNISTERRITQQGREAPRLPFPFGPPMPDFPDQSPRRGAALGSGFIIDPTGYVVTNGHVVEEADTISVILQNERRFEAKLVGRDQRTDLALLKIEAPEPLPYVQWGNSEQAQVGEWTLAIGNPFGLGGTVTAGILSATARDIGQGPYDAFLQTDASINQGNSGGPLFNMAGRVIGINTAIFSPTGGSIGLGFAIPSSLAQPVIAQLRETGTVRRGWLGVQIQQVNPDIAQALGLERPQGALVADVIAGSPAAEAGLRAGDVILSFQGTPLDEGHRLPRLVAETQIGTKAQVTVLRQGKRQQVNLTVAELPQDPQQAMAGQGGGEPTELGLALAPLTDPVKAQLGIPASTQGVLVQGVRQGSPAAERGIRPGDVITQVGQQPVKNPPEVRQQVQQAEKQGRPSVLLLVRRGESQTYVTLDLPRDQQQGSR